jgi:hypothetical protein
VPPPASAWRGQTFQAEAATSSGGTVRYPRSQCGGGQRVGYPQNATSSDGTTHKLYIDGAIVSASTAALNAPAITRAELGSYNASGSFNGGLEDIRIYNVPLAASASTTSPRQRPRSQIWRRGTRRILRPRPARWGARSPSSRWTTTSTRRPARTITTTSGRRVFVCPRSPPSGRRAPSALVKWRWRARQRFSNCVPARTL